MASFVVDGVRVAGLAVEEVGFEVEGVGQAVRGIDAHDQRAIAQAGEFQAGGGGKTGFPDASFAAEEKDAHNLILALQGVKYFFNAETQRQRGEAHGEDSSLREQSELALASILCAYLCALCASALRRYLLAGITHPANPATECTINLQCWHRRANKKRRKKKRDRSENAHEN